MGDKNYKWWTADAEDAEIFQGPYDTRAQAIDTGTEYYEGEPFFVTEADKSVMSSYIDGEGYAESIMEDLADRNSDCFGEDGPDDPWAAYDNPLRSLGAAVEKAVSAWAAEHPGKTWCFGDQRNGEVITPAVAA